MHRSPGGFSHSSIQLFSDLQDIAYIKHLCPWDFQAKNAGWVAILGCLQIQLWLTFNPITFYCIADRVWKEPETQKLEQSAPSISEFQSESSLQSHW